MPRSLPLIRFRFAEPDQATYGGDWYTFDEAQLIQLRARELMALDEELRKELRLNAVTALQSFLAGEARGSLAVMWMARRLAGVDESLGGFDPLVGLADVQIVRDGDVDPPAQPSSPSPGSAEA